MTGGQGSEWRGGGAAGTAVSVRWLWVALLGHAPQSTTDLYVHPTREDLHQAILLLAEQSAARWQSPISRTAHPPRGRAGLGGCLANCAGLLVPGTRAEKGRPRAERAAASGAKPETGRTG
jgi:hypothetical protein